MLPVRPASAFLRQALNGVVPVHSVKGKSAEDAGKLIK